jgi:integrase
MAKNIFRLTPTVVRSAFPKQESKAPTLLCDGHGLYLQITPPGVKSWIYRYRLPGGKTRSMGLGSVYTYSLDDARRRARECRVLVDRGIDPIDARALEARERLILAPPPEKSQPAMRTAQDLKTFRWCADAYLLQLKDAHRNAKHSAQWRSTLERYAYPTIGEKRVDEISSADVVEILEPLFSRIPTTAQRLQQRIEKVLAWCIVRGHRKGQENPARWRAHLSEAIPAARRKLTTKHHNALPYAEMPSFMAKIRTDGSDGSILLQFIILTMCRTGEARGLMWSEVSDDLTMVTIPGERMKGGVEHRIPLCGAAQQILRHLKGKRNMMIEPSAYVFPGRKPGTCISDAAAIEFLKRIDRKDCTPHGMRSAARSWAAECTDFPREVCEQALAHKLRDRVEAAYQRGDYLEKRQALMRAWGEFCLSESASASLTASSAS